MAADAAISAVLAVTEMELPALLLTVTSIASEAPVSENTSALSLVEIMALEVPLPLFKTIAPETSCNDKTRLLTLDKVPLLVIVKLPVLPSPPITLRVEAVMLPLLVRVSAPV